jgi:hypothetical protein
LISSTSFSSSRSTHFPLPPPRLRPSHHMPGLPCRFIWQVEEGGSSASAVDPPSSKAQAQSDTRAGGGAAAR